METTVMPTVYSVFGAFAARCAIVAAGMSVCAALAQDGVGKGSISIGQSTALTGPAAALALPFTQGARMYFDRVNAGGGINGRDIKFTSLDDGGNAAATKTNAQKLVKDGTLVLFGLYGSPQTTAAHEVAKDNDLLIFAPMAAADELRGSLYPQVYSMRPGYSEEAAAITRHANTLGLKKLAIVHGVDAESLSATEAAERTMGALGANLVAKSTHQALDKAIAAKPESIMVINDFVAAAASIKDLRSKGYKGPIYAFSNSGESLMADLLGVGGAGVVMARVTPKHDNSKSALARELAADATAAKLGKPNVYMLEGYIAARTLVEAIRRAGKEPSRAKLKKTIDAMSEFDLGGFRVHFDGDRVGSKLVELTMIDSRGKVRE
jgi:branched-chain amino acid transport system substrate-binding protein